MTRQQGASSLVGSLAEVERGLELAHFVRQCLFEAAEDNVLGLSPIVSRLSDHLGLTPEDADTPAGNVFEAMAAHSPDEQQVSLVVALLLVSLRERPPKDGTHALDVVEKLVWLATHGPFDAFCCLDDVVGEKADVLWMALSDFLVKYRDPKNKVARAEALVAASALGSSTSPMARARVSELILGWNDPTFVRLLERRDASTGRLEQDEEVPALEGRLSSMSVGSFGLFFSLITGWRLLSHLVRAAAGLVLRYETPAVLRVTHRGIEVSSRTRLLGRVLKERSHVIPYQGIALAKREVLFPRLAVYAGIASSVLGSLIGAYWVLGGFRGGSFGVVLFGVVVILLGVLVDMLLTSVLPGRQGRCRVVFVPRRGKAMCVEGVDAATADRVLKSIAT